MDIRKSENCDHYLQCVTLGWPSESVNKNKSFNAGRTLWLVRWIIDDSFLVLDLFHFLSPSYAKMDEIHTTPKPQNEPTIATLFWDNIYMKNALETLAHCTIYHMYMAYDK